ncbi:hypothetical protein [Sciscionella sediminilitoris]|uniref:hypothetical protein n=1 Tax=Sciscionella sediminilitoris TaxID=1445613 RepID=UPI0005641373|nr:hypothetical protein [Sciscionella sp. SE31]
METYLNFMLIRFGILAAGVAVLVIIGFAVALYLKRRGKLGQARRYVEPMARTVIDRAGDRSARTGRGAWKGTAARAVVNYLDKNDKR